jgi:hypothetical protein
MKTGRSAVSCVVSVSLAGEEGGSSRLERGSGHQHLCDLDSKSKGTAYDRFGTKGAKTTFAAGPEEFEGLKNGEWAVFSGMDRQD